MSAERREHPTKTLLIDTATRLIQEYGPKGFTVDRLLTESGISKGSLYHHFHDFTDVVEEAQVRFNSRALEEDIEGLLWLVGENPSPEHMRQTLRSVMRISGSDERRASRLRRVEFYGQAVHGTANFREKLAREQGRQVDVLTGILKKAQDLGVVKMDFSAELFATATMALIFGRVFDDLTEDPMTDAQWFPFIDRFIDMFMI
jgi:AcrR family transcriptional regulator